MPDGPLIAVRFALYLDLGLAFGWPLFGLYSASAPRVPAALLGLAGLVLAPAGFAVQLAAMAGSFDALDSALVATMVRDTPVGIAFAVRLAALALLVAAALFRRNRRAGLAAAAVCGAVALVSLAWNGHAAAGEGAMGRLRLAADMLHLLAAGLWVGALAGLVVMLARRESDLGAAHRALAGFASVGTASVAVLVLSGVVNTAVLAGTPPLAELLASPWARLLLAKLALFAVMLALAAANRFRLTPALARARASGDTRIAARRLRVSLAAEAASASAILLLVAWLGLLAPPGAE